MKQFLTCSLLLIAAVVAGNAVAASQGYATDGHGGQVIRNAYGECWRLSTTYDAVRDVQAECATNQVASK